MAVGHTATEALSAVVAAAESERLGPDGTRRLLDVIAAFDRDDLALLTQPDAQARLDVATQQSWFTTTPGGTVWTVEDGSADDGDAPARGRTGPVLDDAQAAALQTLTRCQHRVDHAARDLAGAQSALVAAGWKVARLDNWGPPPMPSPPEQQAARSARVDAEARVRRQVGAYRYARQARDTAYLALVGELSRGPDTVRLRTGPAPSFHAPSDPVLLVTGTHRGFEHGEDHRFSGDDTLFCRFTGQCVDGIEVGLPDGRTVPVTTPELPVPVIEHPGLPADVADLVAEAFLLDVDTAPLIAVAADPERPWPLLARIRREQTLIWNPAAHPGLDARTIAELSGLMLSDGMGALPSKVAVQVWSAPWSPLYLDWRLSYVPGELPVRRSLDPWVAPADRLPQGLDDLTYTWRAGRPPLGRPGTTVDGRTLLTPQAPDTLAVRLQRTIEQLGDTPLVQKYLRELLLTLHQVRHADVLSQAAGGVNDVLLQLTAGGFRLPADLGPLLAPPGCPPLRPDAIPRVGAARDSFQPIRGGHARIEKLWVVDDFGQVFDVLGAMHTTPESLRPIRAPDLVTAGDPTLIQLTPRLSQPARIDLDWLDRDGDQTSFDDDPATDPVCGWFVLNQLDRGLLVYAADGTALGEVLAGSERALWIPAPDSSPPGGGDAVDIDNRHLRGIVTALLGRPDSRDALVDLMRLIDRSSWAFHSSSGPSDEELPVLLGRPLAVVRAGLRLTLAGPAAIRQGWADSGHEDTGGFTDVGFAVRLGSNELLDDGLVGYYLDDDLTRINGVEGLLGRPERLDLPADAGGYVGRERPSLQADGARSALLTLLLDPGSTVHTVSGILPVTATRLPPGLVRDALDRIAVTVRTGPVLTAGPRVAMPLPALRTGTWTWQEYPDTHHVAGETGVGTTDSTARLLDVLPGFREGWLRLLLHGAPTLFDYQVVPGDVPISTDPQSPSTATLRLSVYNPTGDAVPVDQIAWAVPAGDRDTDLVTTTSTLAARVAEQGPSRWRADVEGSRVRLRPVDPSVALDAGEAVTVIAAGLQVNSTTGSSTLTVEEVTDTTRSGSVVVAKTRTPHQEPIRSDRSQR